MQRSRAMPAPELVWQAGHTPASARFGDIYFSREGGLAETRHVFLNGCDLPQAWRGAARFTIGELGFGTGLNFLATWELWQRSAPPAAKLHYIAVEGFPLLREELTACLAQWPELAPLARALLEVYPPAQPGFHRLFPAPDVTLTLLYGTAAEVLTQTEAAVDAWYLDGFAPERNPAMWDADVLAEVARLSRPDAWLATYSAAGNVRRGLETAGFEIAKAPGFGSKREMLKGRYRGSAPASRLQPWFARATAVRQSGRAVIIGGGIAGTSVARALRRRGWQTTIVDKQNALAEEASGNPAAVPLPRLTAAPNLDGRFYAAAWRFLIAELKIIGGGVYERSGVLQLATDADEAARLEIVASQGPVPGLRYVGAIEAADIAGISLRHGALYFPQGGWLRPRALCAALAAASELRLGVEAATLTHHDGEWRVLDAHGRVIVDGDVVVLANALDAAKFGQTAWMPLQARRGQVTLARATAASVSLRAVLSYGGYVTPADHGAHNIGATFTEAEATEAPVVHDDDHRRNLDVLARVVPALADGWDFGNLGGRAGMRCTTIDHLPVAGPVPEHAAFRRDFAELTHGHPWARYPDAAYHPGLYVLTGLGSHGMVSAPLAAEVVASEITGESWPMERDLVAALHPARFLMRALKRGES